MRFVFNMNFQISICLNFQETIILLRKVRIIFSAHHLKLNSGRF